MEHRCYKRVPISLDADVLRRGSWCGSCRVKDISPDGLGLEVDERTLLAAHEILDLSIKRPTRKLLFVKGFVIYNNGKIAGIMVLDHDPEYVGLISELTHKVA